MNTQAMRAELAVSLPAILRGTDPIVGKPEAFYRARVRRFRMTLGNRPDRPVAVPAEREAGKDSGGDHSQNLVQSRGQ